MGGKYQPAEEYLIQTEPAVRNLFGNLEQYDAILRKIKFPIFTPSHTSRVAADAAFKKWQRGNRAAYKRAVGRQREYLGYRFSIGTLCGSILQIADMGIRIYSKNRTVPSEFSLIIKPGLSRYCIGRRVREVPIGLIIYAARNQYAHWDEKERLKEVNECVFNTLATKHGMKGAEGIKDPAFDLNNKKILIYATNVFSMLGWWNGYDRYIADMKALLTL
jgi:hypothetical protein